MLCNQLKRGQNKSFHCDSDSLNHGYLLWLLSSEHHSERSLFIFDPLTAHFVCHLDPLTGRAAPHAASGRRASGRVPGKCPLEPTDEVGAGGVHAPGCQGRRLQELVRGREGALLPGERTGYAPSHMTPRLSTYHFCIIMLPVHISDIDDILATTNPAVALMIFRCRRTSRPTCPLIKSTSPMPPSLRMLQCSWRGMRTSTWTHSERRVG